MATTRRAGVNDTARLFTHGGSQAVRLPKAFRFEGKEVLIHKEGDRVILEPIDPPPLSQSDLDALWRKIDALADPDEEFPFPPEQEPASRAAPW